MTLQSLGGSIVVWPRLGENGMFNSIGTHATVDAAGEYVAIVFMAREAMTVSHIGFRNNTVAGSPTADVRVETVDGTTGMPTGTLWATDTNIVTGTLTTNTFGLYALTASASIAVGDYVAVKIAYNSGTSFQIGSTFANSVHPLTGLPYRVINTGTPTISTLLSNLNMALGSSTTAFYSVLGVFPSTTAAASTFNSGSSPAVRGLRFKVPFTGRCVGIRFSAGTSTGDFVYGLYSDAGSELSTSNHTHDGTNMITSAAVGLELYFDNPVTLTADTWYRVRIAPSSVTDTAHTLITLPSADYIEATGFGANAHYTTFSGTWDDSATNQVPLINLLFDQLDDGAGVGGGGGGAHILGGTVVR
jgi:hypothetical protein